VSVTKLAVCVCGAEFEQPAIGRRREHCSDACKQRAYRQGQFAPGAPAPPAEFERGTARWRAWLRSEIDRRRREQLHADVAVDRALFADDLGRVVR
jgi:hypothetical protein